MHAEDDVKRAVRSYIIVFVALMVFTLITVGVASLQLAVPLAIAVALAIATIKGSMVAGVFMHLSHEKPFIYGTLVLTVIFFIGLLLWPTIGLLEKPHF